MISFCFVPWLDASLFPPCYLSALSLPSFPPSQTHSLTEDADLIPGMMLSNCHPETDLHNQTIGGKMGHVGKQLFLSLLAWFFEQYVHAHRILLFSQRSPRCTREQSVHTRRSLSYKCDLFLEMSVMWTCFLRAESVLLFCCRCSGYRYKSIEHSSSSSSINTFTCSPDARSLSSHTADFNKP